MIKTEHQLARTIEWRDELRTTRDLVAASRRPIRHNQDGTPVEWQFQSPDFQLAAFDAQIADLNNEIDEYNNKRQQPPTP